MKHKFKLGKTVKCFHNTIEATIIAIDKSQTRIGFYLIGWKDDEVGRTHGWGFRGEDDLIPRPQDGERYLTVNNLKDYKWAYWVYEYQLGSAGNYSKVSRKSLQKRARDQVAQQALTGKS